MKKLYSSTVIVFFAMSVTFLFSSGCMDRINPGIEAEKDMYDRPDKAAEFQINRTKNPYTGKVPSDKMWDAVMETRNIKDQLLNGPNSVSLLTWDERGSFTDVVGPSNGNTRANNGVTSGRIDAIMVDKADITGKTVFIGGDMGGMWKTTDITASPATWTLVNDFMGNLVISSICQDPTNTNTLYMSTGEAYYGGELGVGVFKSTDHGVNWTLLPSTTSYTRSSEILCDAAGNVYLGTNGSGLERSTNGGSTWTDITPSGLSNRIADLKLSATGRLHITTGITAASAYRYTDNPATVTAATWSAPTTPFTSFTQRIEIAVSGNTLYALPCNGSYQVPTIYKSTDGGDNWAATAGQPTGGWASGQGWYALAACINPSDPNQCIVGGLDNFKTTNGGLTWTICSHWVGLTPPYVHADQHNSIWYDNGNKLLFGCDGGIFYSSDGCATASDRNVNLRLKEFYSCAIHPSSTNYFLAGAQDNGTHQLNGPGLTSSVEVTGGDGAYVGIDQDEPQFQYGAYVYNQYRRSTNGGASWSSINFSGTIGQFINPFDLDNAGNIFYAAYAGGQYLRWNDPHTGSSTSIISIPSFVGSVVSAVTTSPYTPNRVYFGTSGGRIVQVDNANAAVPTDVNLTTGGMAGYLNGITIGSSDQNLIACYSSYGVTNVWVSTNGGTSWTGIDGNLPDIPVYWAFFNPDDNTKAYIATETGVWETSLINGAGTTWTPSPNFPTVRTTMLRYRSSDRALLASTYGRGLWTTTVPSASCTPVSITTNPANSTICAGANTTFSVVAAGTAPFTYQWQESATGCGGPWNNIANGGVYTGATTATLTITGITAGMNNYGYRCVVTGNCAPLTATSSCASLTVNAATIINNQPANSTICAGSNTSFSVNATGSSLGYQWQESTTGAGGPWNNITNGGVYGGATTNTLALTAVPATMNTYQYRCVVSSACSPLNSNAAVLTVNAAPAITSQPSNISICAGNPATFTVGATGGGLTYQWQESSTGAGGPWNNLTNVAPYSNVTTATLTVNPAVVGMNNYQYRCIVTGTCPGPATSQPGILSVGTALSITSQPVNSTVCAGSNTSFSITTSGTVISYQWQESTTGAGGPWNNITNGGVYGGTTTATLALTGVTAGMNTYQYRCVVTGSCPSINSNPALLTVNTAPNITSQPGNSSICATQSTSFTVSATGTAITYQWQVSSAGCAGPWTNIANAAPYSGVVTQTLTITGVPATMNGLGYRCLVSGTCSPAAASNCALLTVNTPITTTGPVNSTICATGTTSFTVTAAGTNPTYQWQESTNGGVLWNNIANGGIYSGVTTATLTLTGITPVMNNNQYRAVVTGTVQCGAVNSAAGVLTVSAQPAVTLTAFQYTSLLPGLTTTITASVNPPTGFTTVWTWNNAPITVTGNSYIVDVNKLGVYTVIATIGSCISLPASITIRDSASSQLWVYPNPTDGVFTVSYYTPGASLTNKITQNLTIYDNEGRLAYSKQLTITQAYNLEKVDMRRNKGGVYFVVLRDAGGNKIRTGEVIIR